MSDIWEYEHRFELVKNELLQKEQFLYIYKGEKCTICGMERYNPYGGQYNYWIKDVGLTCEEFILKSIL